jgi:NAD(P)H-hydrate repair Nnr-like enzyme with NAD(P)H-hydrate dehydratase domain
VLTGVIAALLAQRPIARRGGADPVAGAFESAALGAWLHGEAGDRLTARRGAVGVLAGEVAAELPDTIAALRGGERTGPIVAPSGTGTGLALPFP